MAGSTLTQLSQIARQKQQRYERAVYLLHLAGMHGRPLRTFERHVNYAWRAFEKAQEEVRQQVYSLLAS